MTQSVKLTFAQAVPKILFASAGDVRDPDYWSGIPYHMRVGMEHAGWEVDTASPLNDWAKYLNVIAKVAARSQNREFLWDRAPAVLRSYAIQLQHRLKGHKYDFIFSPSSYTRFAISSYHFFCITLTEFQT